MDSNRGIIILKQQGMKPPNKKVLIITYYWPPAGGPGVQRWLKFVKYLRDFDLEPILYIPENPEYPIIDETLIREVPSDIQIIKRKIFEPYALAGIFSKKQTKTISSGIIGKEKSQGILEKTMLYIRGNFFIPDARKFWVKPSIKFLSEFIKNEGIETIISTGPPHSLHLIGLGLKERNNCNWIADFRDPWTNIGYHSKLKLNKASQAKHQLLEARVLSNADLILTTSFTTKKEFQSKTAKPIDIITNGYDTADLEFTPILDAKFSISHIGSLLSGRNPENLWNVLSELTKEHPGFSNDLEIKLTGAVSDEVVESIQRFGLEKNLVLRDYVSHPKALQIQHNSQVLLLIEIDSEETQGIIPGKVFEYLAAKRPILAIGPSYWDVEKIILETNAGEVFNYEHNGKLKEYILQLYTNYKTSSLSVDSHGIEKYSRRELTRKLADLIKQL